MMRTIEVFNCMKRVEFQSQNVGICSNWYNRGCIYGFIDPVQLARVMAWCLTAPRHYLNAPVLGVNHVNLSERLLLQHTQASVCWHLLLALSKLWRVYWRTYTACVITWLCTDSPLPDCYIVLLITPKHPTHSNTGTVTVAELSCTHSFPHNDPMHGFGDETTSAYNTTPSHKVVPMCK